MRSGALLLLGAMIQACASFPPLPQNRLLDEPGAVFAAVYEGDLRADCEKFDVFGIGPDRATMIWFRQAYPSKKVLSTHAFETAVRTDEEGAKANAVVITFEIEQMNADEAVVVCSLAYFSLSGESYRYRLRKSGGIWRIRDKVKYSIS